MKIFNRFCIGILMKTSVLIFLFPELKCFIILTLREVNLLLDTCYCYSLHVPPYLLLFVIFPCYLLFVISDVLT